MSKTFLELFSAARSISTPEIAVRTFDPASTIQNVRKSLDESEDTPLVSWDSIHGLRGINKSGSAAIAQMLSHAEVERPATIDLATALSALEYSPEDVIAFAHNAQLYWADPRVVQGIWNLRDIYKGNGALLVLLITAGDVLPTELQQDILVLDEPLPTREELAKAVTEVFAAAADSKKEYAKCKNGATPEVLKQTGDALIGLPMFPSDQASSMCLNKVEGTIDIDSLWARKRSIISQMPGLSFHTGTETLNDMYGNDTIREYAKRFMTGKHSPSLIVRMDEIEKQLAGNATDSSGVKGDLLGEFLTWVEDQKVICSLFLGIPGSSKSWSTYCIAGQFKKPCINYSLSAMQDSHVGVSGKNQRNAQRTLDSISDGRIWLVATANSLNGLPPELISRFQVGGIFFFDSPDSEEREGIMKLKSVKYGLDAKQALPDMTGWTGRDIDNCARKADMLSISLVDAGEYIVPLMRSHAEQMKTLRMSAHDRFLSASKPGTYQYTEPSITPEELPTAPETPRRKIR